MVLHQENDIPQGNNSISYNDTTCVTNEWWDERSLSPQ